jgi:hypothetical protein
MIKSKTQNTKYHIHKIFRKAKKLLTKTRRRKILSSTLVVLILITSIKFVFLKPKEVRADSFIKFDEGYGTTTNDTSGSASGTITDASWQTSDLCFVEKCLHFDGAGDYVSFGDESSFDFAAEDNFTITGWVRHGPIATNPDYIVAKYEAGTAGGYKIYMDSDGDIVFAIDDDGTWNTTDIVGDDQNKNYDDNKWHHFAAVKDGTSGIYIYVDGQLIDSDTSLSETGTLVNAANFYIGIDVGGSSNSWEGFIDEIKVYTSTARSAAEVKTDLLKSTSSRGSSASFGDSSQYLSEGLVGYWKLDESSGNASDSSGNGYTLTNNGTATFVGAKFANGSEHVPASSQYFSTASTINGVKTVSFWVDPDSNTNYYLGLTGSIYIDSSTGTISATGFTNPTIYVNGTISSTISADTWSLVTVTTDTSINASTFYIGRIGSNYFDGTLDEVRLYKRVLSPTEVRGLYNWAPGPVGHWKFDENTGTTNTYDSSGNGNTGTMNGSMTESDWVPGKYGSALDFDGSDDVVVVDPYIDLSNDLTLEAWIYPNTVSSWQEIINDRDQCTTSTRGWSQYRLVVNTSAELHYLVDKTASCASGSSGDYYRATDSLIPANQWSHVVVTVSSNSSESRIVTFYINGILYSTNQWNDTYTGDAFTGRSYKTHLGARSDVSGYVDSFDGAVDDIRIYNYTRTQAQIIEDMNAGHPAPGSPIGSPVAYWKFDEGYGDTANDSSPQGNNGDLAGSGTTCPQASSMCPTWANDGKYNKALNYDGTDDRVIQNTLLNTVPSELTISGWFKPDATGMSASMTGLGKVNIASQDRLYLFFTMSGASPSTITFDYEANDGGYNTVDSGFTWVDDTWYQVTITWDTTNGIIMYINGEQRATDSNATTLILNGTSDNFVIGNYLSSGAGLPFKGTIDELKVYNFALTEDQVRIDYNRGVSQLLGATSTDSSGNPTWSSARQYCIPGDTSTCNPPIAHWSFDENTGTSSTYDISGNGNTGSLQGSMTESDWVPGKFGSALDFDGSNDRITITDTTDLEPNTLTVAAWIKTIQSGTNYIGVVDKYTGGDAGYMLDFNPPGYTNKARFSIRSATTDYAAVSNNSPSINDGVWHYLVGTYDNSDLKIYIDGVLGDSQNIGAVTINYDTHDVYIGGDDVSTNYIDGQIDEVKIYDYARTPAQIVWDYNRGKPAAYWKLDECSGTTANDASGNGNNGTITIGASGTNTTPGTCSSGNDNEAWNNGTSGKRNASLDFDGTDDYLQVTDTSTLRFDANTQDYALFAWVQRDSNGEMNIISKEDADNDGWRLQFNSSNQVVCSVDAIDVTSSSAITNTNWHHVGCTINRDGNGQTYIDSRVDGTATAISSETMANTSNIRIGTRSYTSTNYFDGQIDDVKIFNYALTNQQIRDIYNSGAVRFGN